MKMAIIGDSPYAVEAAIYFSDIEADVTWFCSDRPAWFNSELKFNECQSLKQYFETSYQEKLNHIQARIRTKHNKVIRVTKRFLLKDEELKGRSRLADLFRVVYYTDPQKIIDSQEKENNEIYQKFTESFKESLSEGIENFEDFDLIIDAQVWNPLPMGSSSAAVRENALKDKFNIHYGIDCFNIENKFTEIALIGSGDLAAEFLVRNREWLELGNNRVFLISTEENPFANNQNTAFTNLMTSQNDVLKKQIEDFLKGLKEWDRLEDYMKAKIPRPEEPIPRVVYFAAHNITCVDYLIDQEKIFLTCEIPSFRKALVQQENAALELKTIGVEACFVLTGNEVNLDKYQSLRVSSKNSLITDEDGLYFLGKLNQSDSFWSVENVSVQLNSIKNDIEKFFSRL